MSQQGDKRENEQWLDMHRDDPDAFGQLLAGKLKDFTGSQIGPGCNMHFQNVRIAYTHLYGFDMEGVGANASLVTRSGNQGNIAELRIPAAAGLLRKAFNIVVGPELTWSAIATTTDFASEAQAITARNALEYYWRHENVGVQCKATQFESMGFAEGALHVPWNAQLGEDVGVDNTDPEHPKLLKTGDIDYRRISTWDIIRDPTAKSREALTWVIVREWPDKFDVAASLEVKPLDGEPPEETKRRAEELREKVISAGSTPPMAQSWLPFRSNFNVETNRIPVYFLYAKRAASVMAGRMTRFLEDGTVLDDDKLDDAYAKLPRNCIGPVVWTASGEYAGTPWPYTKWFGTMGAGQARDALRRDLLTNATATSGNVIAVPESMMDAGASIAFQTGGPQMIPIPPGEAGKIEVLQLQQSHPEHFKLDGTLANEQQQLMGIDNITAGEDIGANLSGAAMALMTSTSVQNNSQEQFNWTTFVSAVGTLTLRHIQFHMKTPRRIALAGNARSGLVSSAEIEGTQVQGIERAIATIGSALQQTDAGKYEIATTALKSQWAKTPEQFQTVLDTGRLDALTEDLSNELLLIKSENEALARGEDVPVMLTDDHRLHIKGHGAVTASLTARKDPAAVKAVQAHEDAHIRVLRETDPQLLQLLGQQPIAPPPGAQPGMPPGAQGGPQAGPPPPGGPSGGPKPPQAEEQAHGPSMPTNPATGQKAQMAGGAMPPALAVRPS
jgi:hypothetical protein